MVYLNIIENTKESLVLERSPGLRSLAVVFGIFAALSIAANQQITADAAWWMPLSIIGCFFVAFSCLDEWEVCSFNKRLGNLTMTRQSIFGKILKTTINKVVIDLETITDVTVESEKIKYTGKNVHVVCLWSEEGHTYQITSCGTSDSVSEHEEICNTIEKFLNLESKKES
ncbi:cytochrome b-245 chaperone 1 homolog [Styela clava]